MNTSPSLMVNDESEAAPLNLYTFAVAFSGGSTLDRQATAPVEREARLQVWNSLTDAQRNACESIECVDAQPDAAGGIWREYAPEGPLFAGGPAGSSSPVTWEGAKRWTMDRGAMPGEPFAFLDGDKETCCAVMYEINSTVKPSLYEVRRKGGLLLAQSESPAEAASIAEHSLARPAEK